MEEQGGRLRRIVGREIVRYETIDSTNLRAALLARQGCREGLVVLAESQNAGRGRRGRFWHSPEGTGLWLSIVLRPEIPPEEIACLALLGALSVTRALRHLGVAALVKWPNDVFGRSGKIAGVLAESSLSGPRISYAIVGIGANVNMIRSDFPDEMRQTASSVRMELGRRVSRRALFASILQELDSIYRDYCSSGFNSAKAELVSHSATVGRMVRGTLSDGRVLEGEATDIGPDGSLIILTVPGGERRKLSYGEVSNLRPLEKGEMS